MISKNLCAIQIPTKQDFKLNLDHLLDLAGKCNKGSIILAPEVTLTGFAYERMEEASDFCKNATNHLLRISKEKTLILTMIEKRKKYFYNTLKVFHQEKIIHQQSKHKLFPLGEEHLHFQPGALEEIAPFCIDNIKCGALNCFELRFIDLWKKIKGAKIVFVPAQWGKARKEHYETLTKALAIANQTFVVASNSSNKQMAKGSAIITPYGIVHKNDRREMITTQINLNEIDTIKKYIQMETQNV